MNKKKLKILIESSMMITIGLSLNFFVFLKMPYGGSITLSLVPILIFSLRNGIKKGIFVGCIFSLLKFIISYKFSLHPLSILLDYLIPGASLGCVSLKRKLYQNFLIVFSIRFLSVFFSGIILWNIYAKGMNCFLYSFIYNFSYIFPETLIGFMSIFFLKKNIRIFNDTCFYDIIKKKDRK